MPAVVLISGMSGAGKTTLADGLCAKHGMIHFDADCWIVGRDPVAEAGATITPEDFQGAETKVPEITKLRMGYMGELMKAFKGGTPDIAPIESFYKPLVAKVEELRAANPGVGIVVSRGSFLRQERDVCRALFGDDFACVVMCVSPELLGNRRLERTKREAAEAGKTLEEHVMAYPASLVPGDTFEAKLKFLGSTNGPTGKEGDADEKDTFNLRITAETTKDAMIDETIAFLKLP